jgi:hypothetical protein
MAILSCQAYLELAISAHFALLEQWTAAILMLLASIRYFTSIFTTSKRLMFLFLTSALVITGMTFIDLINLLSIGGTLFQTTAAFCQNDQRLRQLMIFGTLLWLIHNYLAGSPTAVLMELLFIGSIIIGYYRYYRYYGVNLRLLNQK